MKIRKRRQQLDFGALTEGAATRLDEAEPIEAAPDFDLSPAEPPPKDAEDALFKPATPRTAPTGLRPQVAVSRETHAIGREPVGPTTRRAVFSPAPSAVPNTASDQDAEPIELTDQVSKTEVADHAGPAADAPPAAAAPETPAPESVSATPIPPPEPKPAPVKKTASLETAPASPAATAAVTGPAAHRAVDAPPPAWPIYAGAAVVSILWACAPIAFAWGYRRDVTPFEYDPFALAVFGLLAVGPAALVWIAAYLARQGQLLAREASRAKTLADDMVTPAVIAAGRAGNLAEAVRAEIARASETAEAAHQSLNALRLALAEEAERLVEATRGSVQAAGGLTEVLGRERAEMVGLAETLNTQALSAVEAIDRQSRMVIEVSDLAETQLREAEASLTARAADLTTAAGTAGDIARTAGEDLTRHVARLEAAGAGVAEQISVVESGLVEQRGALIAASQGLRADQEVFAAEAESQTAKLSEFIGQARQSASEMGDRAIKGAEALRGLIAEAADQFREFSDQARVERDAFGASTKQSLEAVAGAAANERGKLEAETRLAIEALVKASEETRQAAERHAEAARAQVDQLSEAAFTAGQRANQVFDARLSEARDLIERSAQMVEQAGAATARKLDEGAAAARSTLHELEQMLGEIETRAAKLPAAARQQAEDVRLAVAKSMDELMQHARRTAEETEAIDLAFQERVRRNYDMLSEAVRMMGTVASGSSASAAERPRSTISDRAPPAPRAPADTPMDAARPGELRQRLRLTPTATDEEFSSVFEAAGGRAESDGDNPDGWTWKELLSSIDEDQGEVSDARIEEALIAEVVGMGIDPAALLPRARIEEIAELVEAGDGDARRAMVRRLAPAATRRLARRLFTDPDLKQQVRGFVARNQRLLGEAAKRSEPGFEPGVLLASDAGRVFLLMDAAGGDAR